MQLPQAPYLGAIVQTDQGIVQLIAVDKVRECLAPIVGLGPQADGSELEILRLSTSDSKSGSRSGAAD